VSCSINYLDAQRVLAPEATIASPLWPVGFSTQLHLKRHCREICRLKWRPLAPLLEVLFPSCQALALPQNAVHRMPKPLYHWLFCVSGRKAEIREHSFQSVDSWVPKTNTSGNRNRQGDNGTPTISFGNHTFSRISEISPPLSALV